MVLRGHPAPAGPARRSGRGGAGGHRAVVCLHAQEVVVAHRRNDGQRRRPTHREQVSVPLQERPRRQQLRELEEHRLVDREVFRQVPPRVDYSATALGLSLEPVMLALCEWGSRHARELDELDQLDDCIVRPVNTKTAAAFRGE